MTSIQQKRARDLPKLRCPQDGCGKRLLISPSGMLVCETGHGRLLPLESVGLKLTDAEMRSAFPDRIIERYRPAEIAALLGQR